MLIELVQSGYAFPVLSIAFAGVCTVIALVSVCHVDRAGRRDKARVAEIEARIASL